MPHTGPMPQEVRDQLARYALTEEGKAARRARQRRYHTSPEGKAARHRYQTSPKGKAMQRRYRAGRREELVKPSGT
jgi:hypothetical protein